MMQFITDLKTWKLSERRSNIYNDRQRLIVANEILCGGLFLPLVNGELYVAVMRTHRPYCNTFSMLHHRWRKMRRAGHEGLSIRASEIYQPLQEREAALLVRDLLHVPEAWDEHLRRYVNPSSQGPVLEQVDRVVQQPLQR